jgi:hypothetical protein
VLREELRRREQRAGTRAGAQALGFSGREHRVVPDALPAELRALEPHGIEDLIGLSCHFRIYLQLLW